MSRRGNMAAMRLQQDYLRIIRDPLPYVKAHPLATNILEWHFAVTGPADTPYEGGIYHGKLEFPNEFPFKPPSIYMITPNGRFKCNTRLCLSISDYHPDTWNPAWSVSTILTGLLSFMVEKTSTLGSIETSDYEKRQLAIKSLKFNIKDSVFCELFPDLIEQIQYKLSEIEKCSYSLDKIRTVQESSTNSHSSYTFTGGAAQAGGSTFTNLAIILGFAAFAYTVKCILMTAIK